MTAWNLDICKSQGIEELKQTKSRIQDEIEAEETERNALQREIERMSYKINHLSEGLAKKAAIRNDYERTIQEAESACTKVGLFINHETFFYTVKYLYRFIWSLKILESSQLLLNMVKREAADLVETLHSAERTETV